MKLEAISLSKLKTETQTHVLTHKWELNNEITWTQGNDTHGGLLGGGGKRRESIRTNASCMQGLKPR